MEKNKYNGNNIGDYPVTIAEKVAVPSMRKRLADLLKEITAVTEAAPVKIETDSITELTKDQLDALKVGDVVAKVTGNMKHLYLVSYKGEGAGQGICLSYNAAGYGETVSYDRTDSGWQYNSTDVKTYGDGPLEVSDITALTDGQLDALEVGDKVAKKTGTAKHLYVVSYKDAENGGLCLTYTDASTVETVSYDHLESGWAYNSTDKGSIPPAE